MSFSLEYETGVLRTVNAHHVTAARVTALPSCISLDLYGDKGTHFHLFMSRVDLLELQGKVAVALEKGGAS